MLKNILKIFRNKLAMAGVVMSILYLIGIEFLFNWSLKELRALPANNVGDFLAGVFGPLAILWLVLGFFQQGIELRHSSEALKLQGQELQNSVEQQRQLVEVSRQQIENDREALRIERQDVHERAQPLWQFYRMRILNDTAPDRLKCFLDVHNIGAKVHNVSVKAFSDVMGEPDFQAFDLYEWEHQKKYSLSWSIPKIQIENKVVIIIKFIDANRKRQENSFEFFGTPNGNSYVMKSRELI